MQLAGRVLAARCPRSTSIHGAEHVTSLFFCDVAKEPEVQLLGIQCCRTLCAVFGSGAMHAPPAMFATQSMSFNKGRKLGLIRAADNRMAGYFIALHRMLRLKKPLQATVASAPWQEMKNKNQKVKAAEALVNDEGYWADI